MVEGDPHPHSRKNYPEGIEYWLNIGRDDIDESTLFNLACPLGSLLISPDMHKNL